MLKVLINEEEVLTNKDFTIKKEMLNTPSVILNNVYPKSWEDEKDYTSNFYHPQDYSKCKIIDESIVPADPGETITGTSFTIEDNDSTKLNELTEIDGNTTQSGTPTPSSPQPINVVSGRQEVSVVGKNLLPNNNATQTINGITFTKNDNGSITLSGTSNAVADYYLVGSARQYVNLGLPTGTYNLNGVSNGSLSTYMLYAVVNRNGTLSYYQSTNTTGLNISVQSGDTFRIFIRVLNSQTPNTTIYPQLEKGSTATTYEEYKGQSYEINLGKNLIDISNISTDNNIGITTTINNNEITFNGTTTNGGTLIASQSTGISIFAGTYTFSLRIASGTFNRPSGDIAFYLRSSATQNIGNPIVLSYYNNTNIRQFTFTITEPTTLWFHAYCNSANIELNNLVMQVQVEKGTQSTNWVQYKTPIELCKINTYKDRIFKENGTWYLHKEIGKVVLNGSEEWIATGTQYTGLFSSYITVPTMKRQNIFSGDLYSNYFTEKEFNIQEEGLTKSLQPLNYDFLIFRIGNDKATNIDSWKSWLSKHNTIVYYILATPTTTEITDTELISQLNGIELLDGLNNVSVSSADLSGEITIHYNYTEEQTIDDLLFCGVVKNSGNISLNPRQPHFQSLQILDFKTFLSEGELDSFVIYQKTILEAIQMVIANIQDYGFILGNINILNPTDVIGAYSTKDKTAYDVFNYIADITQSRWTTRLIDENHVAIDFYDPTLMIEGTPINYTQTFFENNLIDDMTYSYGSNNYRNKQVMTSSQVYSNISQQQSIVANGYQTQFPTEQPIGKINSITSNGIPLTFATFNEKEMGYVADFYYSPGDNYFESEDLRTTGEILIIDYVAIVEGRQIITNPLEIDRINDSTGRKGIISRYEQRNDATTSTELQKIGESYIKYKGTPEIKLKISTRKNIWEVGQRVQFNAPIEDLDTEYMVRTKKINYISTIDTIFYEYELISSFNSETEINYFDNQRAKASGNIGEGEYISRNIDIESTANIIFYDTETTEVQVDGDNELNSILNSPFIS